MSSSTLSGSQQTHGLSVAGLLLLPVLALNACSWTDLGYLREGPARSDATVDTTQREPTDSHGRDSDGKDFVDGSSGGAGGRAGSDGAAATDGGAGTSGRTETGVGGASGGDSRMDAGTTVGPDGAASTGGTSGSDAGDGAGGLTTGGTGGNRDAASASDGRGDATETLLVDDPVDANRAPTVAILVPASGSYLSATTGSVLAVSGTCSVDGQPVDLSGATTTSAICRSGGWSTTLDLTASPEGTITLNADHSDGAGNQASRAVVSVIKDLTAPVPGGALTFTDIKSTSLTVNWPAANDNFMPQAELQYKLVRAPSGTLIDTVSSAKTNGTVVMDWSVATVAASVGGLTIDTLYNYNVLVRDGAGNESVYGSVSQKTLADLNATVAFYPFNGDAQDGSGNGNNLSVTGPTLTANRNAVPGSAYSFDGTSAVLSKVKPSGYSITTALSASVWVYRTATHDQKVIGQFNDICTQGWVIGVDESDNLDVEVINDAVHRLVVGKVPANTWTHLALSWKAGGTLKGYINGLKVSESPVTSTTAMNIYGTGTTNYFKVGAEPWATNLLLFSGSIDDIRVYAKELSPADINALYRLPAD